MLEAPPEVRMAKKAKRHGGSGRLVNLIHIQGNL